MILQKSKSPGWNSRYPEGGPLLGAREVQRANLATLHLPLALLDPREPQFLSDGK